MTAPSEEGAVAPDESSRDEARLTRWLSWTEAFTHEGLGKTWDAFLSWWVQHQEMLLFVFALIGAAYFGRLASVPESPTTPGGMLALELPGTRSNALSMIALLREGVAANGDIGEGQVIRALTMDFFFVAYYVLVLWLAMKWAIQRYFKPGHDNNGPGSPSLRLVDRFAGWSPLVAGAFDYLENIFLLLLLRWASPNGAGAFVGGLASLTTLASVCKWTVLMFILIYLARLLVLLWWRWISPPQA